MLTRKRTLLLVLLLAITSSVWCYGVRRYNTSNTLKSSNARITTDFDNSPKPNLVDTNQALAKGQAQLLAAYDQVSPNQKLILDFLQRKFNLNDHFSAKKTHINSPVSDTEEWRLIKRIAYPDELENTLPPYNNNPTIYMVMAAANCDHIKQPTNLGELIKRNVSDGGYSLLHVVLSLEFMRENGCNLPVNREFENQVIEEAVKLADNPQASADLHYEAIAMLYFSGHKDLVKSNWLAQIIQEQNPDGNWDEHVDDKQSSDHATVLALWSLLEYSQPNTTNEPMIRHPLGQAKSISSP